MADDQLSTSCSPESVIAPVAALFVRRDSIYKTLPGVECYDIDRDALTFSGGMPVVAHPPCRAWGRLRRRAKPLPGETELAPWSVSIVRREGGVLEHPAHSTLWQACQLPTPRAYERDDCGGWTLSVDQFWWGHRARKATWLYICGVEPVHIPPIPLKLGDAPCVIDGNGTARRRRRAHGEYVRPAVTRAERERTPPEFARWLVELARRCSTGNNLLAHDPLRL